MDVPDHGPLIVGVTWGLTALSGAFLGLRLYAKLSRKQGLWWDDHILIFSWILLLGEAATTQAGQILGFGKRTQDIQPQYLATIALGSAAISTVSSLAATMSKISFGVTLLRLTSGCLRWFVWFCIVSLFLIMLPSALSPWIQCETVATTWNDSHDHCWASDGAIDYGIFNAAWCATADFALALLPWYLIWGLQLKFREKIGVGIAMSMGMLSGICAIVKGVYVIQLREQDFSYNGKDLVIWTVVETATAIVGASIPVLRVFFKETISSYSRSRARTAKNVPLSRLNQSQHSTNTTTVHAMPQGKEGVWSMIAEEGDSASQRGILEDEEMGRSCRQTLYESDGIMQTSTVTVTIESDARSDHKARSFLGIE